MFRKIMKIVLKVFFFLLLFGFAISLILFGLYYSKITDKEYIFGNMIDMVFEKGEQILKVDSDYRLGNTFQVDGTIKMELSSEEYRNKSLNDIEFKKKNQMLSNLSLMDTFFVVQQDVSKGKAFVQLDEKIKEEEIFKGSFYIENSTQYFFVDKILSYYVNDGSNNYFESYTEEVTTSDNVLYLYNFIRDSIKNNIDSDNLTAYDVKTLAGEDEINAGEISYRFTDKSIKALLKGVLKDLKKDERSRQILSLIYPNIDDLKVNDKEKILKSNESYTINVYVAKPFFNPFKYELVYMKDDEKEIYTYEGDLERGIFYYSLNNVSKYHADYQSTSKKTDIMVYDSFDHEVGTIKIEKDKKNLMFTMTLELEKTKYDIVYTSKNKDLKNNSYTREDNLSFKIMDDKVVHLQGKVDVNSTISGTTKIMEDTSSSILKSSLTDEENEKLDSLYDKIKERLEK